MCLKLSRCLAAFLFATVFWAAASASDLPLVGDASVNSSRSTTTAGTVSNLYVSNSNNTFFQFDTTALPAGTTAAQVAKATLLVFVNRVNTAGAINVSPVTGTWTEGSITYATQPTVGSAVATFSPASSSAGQYIAVDITSTVKAWVAGTTANYGLTLTTSAGDVVLDSKENDQTAHPARLDVTLAPSTLTAGIAAGQLYLTGASGAVPTTPVSVSGDAILGSTGVLAISSTAGASIVTAINAGSSVIGTSKLGTGSGGSTTFLNGSGAFAAPIVLTTTGTSGAATLSGNTLNIPTAAGGGVTSVSTSSGNATPSASINGTALTINFPTSGLVTASSTNGSTNGSVQVTGSNLAINFPAGLSGTNPPNIYYATTVNPGASPYYMVPFGSAQVAAPTAAELTIVPQACTLSGLNVSGFSYSPGTSDGLTATIYVNGSLSGSGATFIPGTATALSCSLFVPTAGSGQSNRNSCNSGNSAQTLAAGDNYYVVVSETNAANSPYFKFAVTAICK